ncbi:MAG: (d)CMP kinase [Actinobacteria bacterium]|nr:(d)CMP kinase [Actinomycetota bacterium]
MNAGEKPRVIAIDGPAASGKSTVALSLSRRLGFRLMDSGSMYRAVALLAVEKEVQLDDENTLFELARSVRADFRLELPPGASPRVFLGDRDVTEAIRSPGVGEAVSPVSVVGGVRKEMVSLQRESVSEDGVVAEGRDIGTVVFSDAPLKVYLDAALEERIDRRYKELTDKGMNITRSSVEKETEMRDTIDSSREHSPLSIAPDAVLIDTTDMSVVEVVEEISKIWNSRQRDR